MPNWGIRSKNNLNTCERDIQTIFNELIKVFDCSVVAGKRTAEEQNKLWAKGRDILEGSNPKHRNSWGIVDKSKVVTYKDGYEQLSNHQSEPKGKAIDAVPYPEMWSSKERFQDMALLVKDIQIRLLEEGKITNTLDWGFDLWGWDMPHWQIKR